MVMITAGAPNAIMYHLTATPPGNNRPNSSRVPLHPPVAATIKTPPRLGPNLTTSRMISSSQSGNGASWRVKYALHEIPNANRR